MILSIQPNTNLPEVCIPPEYMKALLPCRATGWHRDPVCKCVCILFLYARLSCSLPGRPEEGHPTIAVEESFDVWSFGVLLYELCTGVDLWHKAIFSYVKGAVK